MRASICNWLSIVLLFGVSTEAWIPYKLIPFQIDNRVLSSTLRPVERQGSCRKNRLSLLHLSNDVDPSRQPSDDDQGFAADCDNEEECEIDWDAMPDSTSETTEEIANYATTNNVMMSDVIYYDDFDAEELDTVETKLPVIPEMTWTTTSSASATSIPDNLRTRLEMQWQMTEQTEDCDVYKPVSCGGEQCTTCGGTGTCKCRFCRGTGYIYLKLPSAAIAPTTRGEQVQLQREEQMFGGNLNSLLQTSPSSFFVNCNICQQKGHETCKVCQGSGWIAGWTNVTTK
jgi:hypothetical protein